MATKVTTTVPAEGAFEFTDVPVPESTHTPKANAFTPKVQAMSSQWDDDLGRSTTAANVTVPAAEVGKYTRMIESAGKAVGKSVRKTLAESGENVVITFWVVNKITRTAKPADDAPVA